jgi:dynein heavy chain
LWQNDPPVIQKEWASFVRKIDKRIEEALRTTTKKSLQEFARAINFDAQSEPHDLFKVNVVLDEPKARIEFRPTMASLQNMVNDVAKQLITTVQVIPRLSEELKPNAPAENFSVASPSARIAAAAFGDTDADDSKIDLPSFYDIISNDDDILKVLVAIMNGVTAISSDLQQLIKPWEAQTYRQIWEPDKEAFIRRYALTKRNSFQKDISQYRDLQAEIQGAETLTSAKFIRVDFSQLKQALIHHCVLWQQRLTSLLHSNAHTELSSLHSMFLAHSASLQRLPDNLDQLGHSITLLKKIQADLPNIEARFEPLDDMYKLLDKFDVNVSDEEKGMAQNIRTEWNDFQDTLKEAETMLNNCKINMKKDLEDSLTSLVSSITSTRQDFTSNGPFSAPSPSQGEPDVDGAFKTLNDFKRKVQECRDRAQALAAGLEIFNIEQPSYKELDDTTKDTEQLEIVWGYTKEWVAFWSECKICPFMDLNSADMDLEAQKFQKNIVKLSKSTKLWKVSSSLKERVDQFRAVMPIIKDLRNPALRPRHWDQLKEEIQQFNFDPAASDFTLDKIFLLGIHQHAEAIGNLSSVANRELNLETGLEEIRRVWDTLLLDIGLHKEVYFKLRSTEELSQFLEDHQVSLGTMKNSPFYSVFAERINHWAKALNDVAETIDMILNVQRQWMYLESIFIGSEDIRRQLPAETIMFEKVNKNFLVVMTRMNETKYAIRACCEEGLLDKLTQMNETLEKIQKSLDQYLEQKRQEFPRFYFLSNDDLLEILGQSRDPLQVQKHIRKCFAGIKVLELVAPFKAGNRTWEATGMKSAEGEVIPFSNNVACEGAVEGWLNKVEAAMFITLQRLLRDAVSVVQKPNSKKDTWVKSTIGQHLVTSGQISWTAECTRQLLDLHKNKKALRALYARWNQYLERLSGYIRGNLNYVDRLKLVSLITIELHARDVIEDMARATNISGPQSFDWLKQLRFYFDKDDGDFGMCLVKQTSTSFRYGYEYQGNATRLVVTSLTDRCYMTLTTALHLNRGGAPQGPAGTGKTETVKDLGKGLAKYVVVFNCSDGMDFMSIGQSFSGLVQTGAWGCFDEFNRIDIEVLSVVGQQVGTILSAIAEKKSHFNFEGRTIRLNPTCGIFITMNPGYAGRSELPDNLKSLFRPVAMMLPEFIRIAEVALASEGFKTAGELARKLVTLYDLMKQQFSKQDHYDFGMRAVKSVLNRAGQLYRTETDVSEEILLMRALRDMNVPKLVTEDVPLFQGLFQDLFPNTELHEIDSGAVQDEIRVQLQKAGLQVIPASMKKILQLYESKLTRHGNMLVGSTLSGKSTAWQILQKTMNALNKTNPTIPAVEVSILNPKSITIDELFGVCDLATREWTDGVLSNIMRRVCMDESDKEKWIVLDGPVDTLWIESMNTVLDDNKILTLLNGDRIALPPSVSLLFEVEDLSVASPATVSRAGMVFVNADDLGWRPFVDTWLAAQPRQDVRELLTKMIEKHVSPLLDFRKRECKELIPVGDFHAIRALTNLFDSLCTVDQGVDPSDESTFMKMVEMSFLVAIVWSIGASVDASSRPLVDKCLRESEAAFPPLNLVYDYWVDPAKKDWAPWEERVPKGRRTAPGTPFHRIMIPTVDTVRHGFIASALMKARHAVLAVGATGTGKTSLISNILGTQDEGHTSCVTINFSAATTATGTQEIIESRLEKRQRTNYGPKNGKARLICFVDDLNMPRKEKFGAQPPLELLRQWMEYGMWYETQKQQQRFIVDMQLVASMGPPGGARSAITRRFLSKFNLINFPFPSDDQIKRIFESIIADKLVTFGEEIKPLGEVMTVATIELYKNVISEFLPTPSKSHYLFNMRDISKVFQGLLQCDRTFYDSKEIMTKLWVHECMRVFHDRLVDIDDRQTFKNLINNKLQTLFSTSWSTLFGENSRGPLFTDFISDLVQTSDQKEPTRIYQEIAKLPEAKKIMEEKLEELNNESGSLQMDLVLFEDAIDHTVRIYRVLRQNRGSLMLVGVGGSGRQSLTRLASFIAELDVKLLDIRKGYRVSDWREDIKQLYLATGLEKKNTVFLFLDSQIQDPSFMEDINNILSSGEITNLFPADELQPIFDAIKPDCMKENRGETADALYSYFIDRVRNHLHLVLCMSPIGDGFRERCRMYPSLVNTCAIDWFSEWPDVALREVSARFLSGVDLGSHDNIQESMAEVFCRAHLSVSTMSKRMAVEIRRYTYVTPTNYLDLVKGYRALLGDKRRQIGDMADKLRNGLSKLDEARQQVADMSVSLEVKKRVVAQKKAESEKMLIEIVQQQRIAEEQKKSVESDASKIEVEEKECSAFAADAQKDLDAAEPELRAAQEALDALKKDSITEVRSFVKPLPAVEKVLACVMLVLGKDQSWATAKKEMGESSFLTKLKTLKPDEVTTNTLKIMTKRVSEPDFDPEDVKTKSSAAGALAVWCIATQRFITVYRNVAPKRAALQAAMDSLEIKRNQMATAKEKLRVVLEFVANLQDKYEKSESEKNALRKEALDLETKLQRAGELVSGLGMLFFCFLIFSIG